MTGKPRATRSDRGTNANLASACRAANQKETRDIGAGENQHQPDGSHQHHESGADVSGDGLGKILGSCAMIVLRSRIGQSQAPHDGVQVGPRVGERNSGLQKTEHAHRPAPDTQARERDQRPDEVVLLFDRERPHVPQW